MTRGPPRSSRQHRVKEKTKTESHAGGGKAHDDPVMAPVGAAGTLLRPGAQTGSSPVDTSVRKAEAGVLTREDRPRTLSQRTPVPQNTGRHTTREASLKSGALGTLRDSPATRGAPPSTWSSQGGSPRSCAAAAPTRPARGGLLAGAPPAARHSGGATPCQVLCWAGRRRGLTQSLGFPGAETPGRRRGRGGGWPGDRETRQGHHLSPPAATPLSVEACLPSPRLSAVGG